MHGAGCVLRPLGISEPQEELPRGRKQAGTSGEPKGRPLPGWCCFPSEMGADVRRPPCSPGLTAAPCVLPGRQDEKLFQIAQAFYSPFQTQTDHLTLHDSLTFHFTQGNKNNSLNHFKYGSKSLTTLTFSKVLNRSPVDSQSCC